MIFSHSNVPPNQGGRYSGFGNTVEQPPRSQSQDLLDSAVSSFSSVSYIHINEIFTVLKFIIFCRNFLQIFMC